jgi:hypothetical protein
MVHIRRTNTTHNRGTELVSVPIQFRIGSFRLNWQIVHKDDGTPGFAGSCFSGVSLENIEFGDGWELVRQYLNVRPEDERSILEFLAAHGIFGAPAGSVTPAHVRGVQTPVHSTRPADHDKSRPEPVRSFAEAFSLQEFAMIQDYVRRMLINGNPTLPTPWHGSQIQRYEIAFADARHGSRAHVMVRGTFPSILATVQFKLLQGAMFRTCARRDCRLPFEVTSLHTRRFCTQYCAHITSLRQRREVERRTKNKKKR